jgi:hypothetical protein
VVIEGILKKGYITTEELKKKYGYEHPPRAACDVREAGIPLETFRVKSSDGRSIAAYRLDNKKIERGKSGGRKVFSKDFKNVLYKLHNEKCAVCSGHFEKRYLQIDHRIPYGIAGESKFFKSDDKNYMLLCGSCNRAKSWSCEHCENWHSKKSSKICTKCYWASPDEYSHIALREIKRMDIIWEGKETEFYNKLKNNAKKSSEKLPDYVKKIISKLLKSESI